MILNTLSNNAELIKDKSYLDETFKITSGEPGPIFQNCLLTYRSPTKTAITAINQPRVKIYDSKIVNASIGINMQHNSGGTVMRGLELSSKHTGIIIDGCLDTVRITDLHNWCFGMPLIDFMGSWGIVSGRCDGLILDNCFFINRGIKINGHTLGVFSNLQFDSWATLHLEHYCEITMTGGYFSQLNPHASCIFQSAGILQVSNMRFHALAFPFWQTGGYLSVENCTVGLPEHYWPNGAPMTNFHGDRLTRIDGVAGNMQFTRMY